MPTVVIGNNTGDDYSGTEDAQIKESYPTRNYGGRSTFEITKYASEDHTHALIRFSLAELPESIDVSSATISLYCNSRSSGTRTATLRRLLRTWIEGTGDNVDRNTLSPWPCCWDEYGEGNTWTTAGAMSDGNDRSATTSATLSMSGTDYLSTSSGGQLETDIENGYNSWQIERTDGSNDSTYDVFGSSEGTDGYRPYLAVTYTESGGSSGHPAASRFRHMSNNNVRYA